MKYSIRILMVIILLICTSHYSKAQTHQWTWVNGPNALADATKNPPYRTHATFWTDHQGNIWMFGGTRPLGVDSLLNDLWKWDGKSWTLIKNFQSPQNQEGYYGTKKHTDSLNIPCARSDAGGWVDKKGNLWLFGGISHNYWEGFVSLNDLWKFDGKDWTWMNGSPYDSLNNDPGVYRQKGITDTISHPGKRSNMACWVDSLGNGWVYGGAPNSKYSYAVDNNNYNDLWKWDGSNWTWMNGTNQIGSPGVYGTMGVSDPNNLPHHRNNAACWTDSLGQFWLFGGKSTFRYLNDLWKWDGKTWTWMGGSKDTTLYYVAGNYGTIGIENSLNYPSSRIYGKPWTDKKGNFWLLGGEYRDSNYVTYNFNELWRLSGKTWTWMGGSNQVNQTDIFGKKGIADSANWPGCYDANYCWKDSTESVWLYNSMFSDLWKYKNNQWTWLGGNNRITDSVYGKYVAMGVPDSTNSPGQYSGVNHWASMYTPMQFPGGAGWTDKDGNSWMYGSEGGHGMWKWDGSNWTWMYGSQTKADTTVFGTIGVPDATNSRGARNGSISWQDSKGNIWFFGGIQTKGGGYYNDLWKWDGAFWTWFGGSANYEDYGPNYQGPNPYTKNYNYGKQGVPDPSNRPPGRINGISWIDSKDNLWLFGGFDYFYRGFSYMNNDLWKWDGTNWTWVSGTDPGSYGKKGVPDPTNFPAPRCCSVTWIDKNDNLWLFGGFSWTGALYSSAYHFMNDLWKWDGKNWTWISGGDQPEDIGNYGQKTIADSSNLPGARGLGKGWVDGEGNFWLFGGLTRRGILNDLWKWDGKNWTWMDGTTKAVDLGVYGTKGITDSKNIPGARFNSISWNDKKGNFWIYGGQTQINIPTGFITNQNYTQGYAYVTQFGYADLWKYNYGTPVVTAINNPVAPIASGQIVLLNNPTNNNQISLISDKHYTKLNWEIIDLNGRPIQEGVFKLVVKGSRISAATKSLTPGTYFIKLTGDNKSVQTKKWIRF